MVAKVKELLKNEDGATAIEYSLIAAATGLAIAALMPGIKTGVEDSFVSIANTMN